MDYELVLAPEAADDLRALDARHRANVVDALERHLRHEPWKVSRSRIKRLRGLRRPQYRLKVDEYRVFYDLVEMTVQILAIVHKPEAERWLRLFGEIE
jgi:mRNA-degrading endonuclease RelE of RelBE toxin-antitoxin system